MFIELVRLKHGDSDLDELIRIHQEPSVSRFLSTSDNYFKYVTGTESVDYYKIIVDGILVGGIHSEIDSNTVSLSICVDEKHRCLGIAEKSLQKFFSLLPSAVKTIEVFIEETNIPSILLFQKLGFQTSEKEQELIKYCKLL